MKTHFFRSALKSPQILAIDPKALDVEYSEADVETKENASQVGIGLVNICGPLEHHKSWIWDSYDAICERLECAFADSDNRAVIMCIDSPGGDAAGATEVHRKIQRLKKKYQKKLYAYSNEAMYSAAYSIGCAADEIWVPSTGGVGSVGVICALLDKTEYNKKQGLNIQLLTTGARKADTHADRPLTDEIVESMQERVDYLGDVFFKLVSKSRGMSTQAVKALEAGCFLGKQAVESGLADDVGGWYKFLQHVSEDIVNNEPSQDESEPTNMKTKAQLKKERDAAATKLASARSESERKKLFALYETAVSALADFEAKTKYVKKTEETEETDDDEEDEEETEEDDEEEESEESDDDDDDDSDEDEEEEEEEDSKKSKKSKASTASSLSLKQVGNLFKAAVRLTGKQNISEIIGALDGQSSRKGDDMKLRQDVAKMKTESKRARVKSMLTSAKKERRVTPAEAKGLLEAGMRDPQWLKGYLSSLAPKVKSADDMLIPDFENDQSNGQDTLKSLSPDMKKMLSQAAHSANMSVEDYYAKFKETQSNKSNGTPAVGR